MKKTLFIIIVLIVLGIGYWLISPLWRVEKVSEALSSAIPADMFGLTKTELLILKKLSTETVKA